MDDARYAFAYHCATRFLREYIVFVLTVLLTNQAETAAGSMPQERLCQ